MSRPTWAIVLPVLLNSVFLASAADLKELTEENFDKVVNGSSFVFVIFYAPWDAKSTTALQRLESAMDELGNRKGVIVAKVDAYNDVKLATRFWIDKWPIFRYFIEGSVTPETYEGAIRTDDFVTFIKLTSEIQADPSVYFGSFIEMDKSNFERIIYDKTKDVFVLFYTPWCEDCKLLKTTIQKVGEKFKNEKDCVVGEIDGDKYYSVTLKQEVSHYPTIKVFTKKNKDGYIYYPGKFQENWSEVNITKFLNLQCRTKRTLQGELHETVGRVEDFDNLVKRFMEQSYQRQNILNEARELTRKSYNGHETTDIYLNIMKKILKEGTAFLTEELDRTERLIQSAVHPQKSDEFQKRRNILKQFALLHHERDEL